MRFEILRHFGYFVTESSTHMSEYVPWFRRTPELRARFESPHWRRHRQERALPAGEPFFPEEAGREGRERQMAEVSKQLAQPEPWPFRRTPEYCSFILHAVETNTPYRFNGNVMNTGLITNLPLCNVEVPILVDSAGLHPCFVGELPSQCADQMLSCASTVMPSGRPSSGPCRTKTRWLLRLPVSSS